MRIDSEHKMAHWALGSNLDCTLQAILEDLQQAKKIPSEKLKRQPVLVGASAVAAIAGLGAVLAASLQLAA